MLLCIPKQDQKGSQLLGFASRLQPFCWALQASTSRCLKVWVTAACLRSLWIMRKQVDLYEQRPCRPRLPYCTDHFLVMLAMHAEGAYGYKKRCPSLCKQWLLSQKLDFELLCVAANCDSIWLQVLSSVMLQYCSVTASFSPNSEASGSIMQRSLSMLFAADTKQGLALAALCACAAPVSELIIMNVFGLWHYPHPNVFQNFGRGLPSW